MAEEQATITLVQFGMLDPSSQDEPVLLIEGYVGDIEERRGFVKYLSHTQYAPLIRGSGVSDIHHLHGRRIWVDTDGDGSSSLAGEGVVVMPKIIKMA